MIKFDRILEGWRSRRGFSERLSDSEKWFLDESPEGVEELIHFEDPDLLVSPEDTRDILENRDYESDIDGKKEFRKFASRVGGWWAFFLVAVVLAQGFDFVPFSLDPEEFIAVVGVTTGSIFGIVYVVGRYLYGSKAYASKTKSADSVATK